MVISTSVSAASSSHRPTRWSPLAYPSSCLFTVGTKAKSTVPQEEDSGVVLNPFFPLHSDIILAAVRELLILDGTLDKETLCLVNNQKHYPSFSEPNSSKNDDTSTTIQKTSNSTKTGRKRKLIQNHDSNPSECLRHLNSQFESSDETSTSELLNKNLSKKIRISMVKKQKLSSSPNINIVRNDIDDDDSLDSSSDKSDITTVTNERHPILTTAQYIANCILNKTLPTNQHDKVTPQRRSAAPTNTINEEKEVVDKDTLGENSHFSTHTPLMSTVRPPRKVSDVDETALPYRQIAWRRTTSFSNQSAALALIDYNLTTASTINDFEWNDEAILKMKDELPSLLEVSICVEFYLRNLTNQMVLKMARSFDDKILRMFMGYKSSLLKRENLLQKLSDFLFDVSHAYFAWKQTEWELAQSSKSTLDSINNQRYLSTKVTPFIVSSVVKKNTDSIVRDTLFDRRALKKIGGCDSPSLFMHALSIGRLAQNNISWESFAKTGIGKKMLKHHIGNPTDILAQNRKLHRSGLYRDIGLSNGNKKSSTTTAYTAPNGSDDGKMDMASSSSSRSCDDLCSELPTQPAKFVIPTNIPITLKRKKETSWGILLSKEESLCVVMRVNNKTQNDDQNLKEGDLITSIRNEINETILISPSNMYNQQKSSASNWFKEAIDLFKRSTILHLEVQRIHSNVPAYVM